MKCPYCEYEVPANYSDDSRRNALKVKNILRQHLNTNHPTERNERDVKPTEGSRNAKSIADCREFEA